MTFIYFIIFYWIFSYLFLVGCLEFEETENTWFKKFCKLLVIYIIGGFMFPLILGDLLNDIIKHFNIRQL